MIYQPRWIQRDTWHEIEARDQIPHPVWEVIKCPVPGKTKMIKLPSPAGRKRRQMPEVCPGGMLKLRFDCYISCTILKGLCISLQLLSHRWAIDAVKVIHKRSQLQSSFDNISIKFYALFRENKHFCWNQAVEVIAVNWLSSSLLDPSTQECNGSSLQASAPVCVLLGSLSNDDGDPEDNA